MEFQLLDIIVEHDDKKGFQAFLFGNDRNGDTCALGLTDFRARVHVRVPIGSYPSAKKLQAYLDYKNSRMVLVKELKSSDAVLFRGSYVKRKYVKQSCRYLEVLYDHKHVLARLKKLFPTSVSGYRQGTDSTFIYHTENIFGKLPRNDCHMQRYFYTVHGHTRTSKVQVLLSLDIRMRGWISVSPDGNNKLLACKKLIARRTASVKSKQIRHVESEEISPLRIAAFDIETHARIRGGASGRRGFPRPHVPGDVIISIAVAYACLGKENEILNKKCYILGPCHHKEATSFNTESDLLSAFREDVLINMDASWIVGYNSDQFDWWYLCSRATLIIFFQTKRSSELLLKSKDLVRSYRTLKKMHSKAGQVHMNKRTCKCVKCIASKAALLFGINWYSSMCPPIPLIIQLISEYENIESFEAAQSYFGAQATTSFFELHRFHKTTASLTETTLTSSAFGENTIRRMEMMGTVSQDLYLYMKQSFKFKSYKLKSVCAALLDKDAQKGDLDYQDMFERFEAIEYVSEDNSVQFDAAVSLRDAIVSYNIQDAVILLQLLHVSSASLSIMEQSRVCHVTPQDIISRGQQIRVYSQLYYECWKSNMIMNQYTMKKPDNYKGATVLPPTPGYYRTFVATLDFASLYPSIIRAYNISPDTLVTVRCNDSEIPAIILYQRKAGVKHIEIDIEDDAGRITHTVYFISKKIHHGILPKLVSKLLTARKRVKVLMKQETDPARKKILDCRQKQLKVSANSCYGFFGTGVHGMLPMWVLAAAITSMGRKMIQTTKREVQGYDLSSLLQDMAPEATVIYGGKTQTFQSHIIELELLLIGQSIHYSFYTNVL